MPQPYVMVEPSGRLFISDGSGPPLLVASVRTVPHLDTWADLVERLMGDETIEYPIYTAAQEAVRRWGGRLEVVDPEGALA